jgi:hypothetical protein
MTGDEPSSGRGLHGRLLWTERDRDAEATGELPRRAGCRERGKDSETRGGFVVVTDSPSS